MHFSDFGLADSLLRAVVARGYTIPTPVQAQSIPHVLEGRDVLACAQTGTGKTAAFALPILHRLSNVAGQSKADNASNGAASHAKAAPRGGARKIRVLVLSPTRELTAQIFDSFRAYGSHTGLRSTVIFGGVGYRPQIQALQQGVDIVIATPGRLLDLMQQGHVDLSAVETFVLDEADRMLDMGFMPDIRRLVAKLPAKRQTVMFSATMPEPIERLANAILRNPAQVRIAPVKETTELIEQRVCFIPTKLKPRLLTKLLGQGVERAIVFTRTKHGANRVTKQLCAAGIPAQAIHGNKSQAARQRSLASFKSNRPPVLVATDVAARGIDVSGVSHVFNYDLPDEPETYVHRIGRTGRAGATGIAIAFCDQAERSMLKSIERLIRRPLVVDGHHPIESLPEAPAAEASGSRGGGNGSGGNRNGGGSRSGGGGGSGKRRPEQRGARTNRASQRSDNRHSNGGAASGGSSNGGSQSTPAPQRPKRRLASAALGR
jgi:ATP-dependent RNA helicase RhlE